MGDVFEKNLQIFSKENPEAAAYLVGLENHRKVSVHESDVSSALKELDLGSIEILFSFGLCQELFDTLQNWLENGSKRRLIFFENDLGVIHQFLEQELLHPQVKIFWLHGEDPFRKVTWTYLNRLIGAVCLKEGMKPFKQALLHKASEKNCIVSEFLDGGKAFFSNFYRNLFCLPEAYIGESLFGKFHDVPAIICGAGPSLEKHIGSLGGLKKKALLFAGSSARNVLDHHGILPHFGAGIDPGEKQHQRIAQVTHNEVPFFYRDRINYKALLEMKGSRLHISGAGGYPVADWIMERLHLPTTALDEGHNVVNFCTTIAEKMGCNPIIYVGMDLAYTGGKTYAEGVLGRDIQKKEGIQVKDVYGEDVLTKWLWVTESEWISEFAMSHPETQFINTTEGGIGFKGVENCELKSMEKKFTQHYKFESLLRKMEKSKVMIEQIVYALNELKNSLKGCRKKLELIVGGNGPIVLHEIELEEEEAYRAVLEPFDKVHARMSEAQERELSPEKERVSRCKYLLKVVQVNLECIDEALSQ